MLQYLQLANHKVWTAYGILDDSYRASSFPLLQGLGQGNGAAPAAWAIISTPIINIMQNAGFGIKFRSPFSTQDLSFICYAFVNNTDILHSPWDVKTTGETIITEMQS